MVDDFFRGLIWGLGSIVLGICDVCFSILKTVSMIDVTSFGSLWSMWTILTAFVGMFILFKVAKIWTKVLVNEEYRDKVKIESIIFRMIPIVLVLSLLPVLVGYAGQASTYFVKNVSTFVGVAEDQQISETIINAASFSGTIQEQFENSEKNEIEVTYTFAEVNKDINAKKNGKYMFFPNYGSLFAGIFMGLGMAWLLILLVMEVSKRIFAIGAKILISPIPIAGLIDPDDNTFGKWLRSIGTDFLANFIQIYLVYFAVIFANSSLVRDTGMISQLLLMIGGLLSSLQGIPAIADLIGVDVSGSSALTSLAQIGQTRMGFGNAGAFIGGAALTGAAIGGHMALKTGNGGFNMLANSKMGQNMGLNPTKLTTAKAGVASKNLSEQLKASNASPFSESHQKNVIAGKENTGEASYAGSGKVGGLVAKLDNAMTERISKSKVGRMTSRPTGWVLEKTKGLVQRNSDMPGQPKASESFSSNNSLGNWQTRQESFSSNEMNRFNQTSQMDPFASYREPRQSQQQEQPSTGIVKRFDSNGRDKSTRL